MRRAVASRRVAYVSPALQRAQRVVRGLPAVLDDGLAPGIERVHDERVVLATRTRLEKRERFVLAPTT